MAKGTPTLTALLRAAGDFAVNFGFMATREAVVTPPQHCHPRPGRWKPLVGDSSPFSGALLPKARVGMACRRQAALRAGSAHLPGWGRRRRPRLAAVHLSAAQRHQSVAGCGGGRVGGMWLAGLPAQPAGFDCLPPLPGAGPACEQAWSSSVQCLVSACNGHGSCALLDQPESASAQVQCRAGGPSGDHVCSKGAAAAQSRGCAVGACQLPARAAGLEQGCVREAGEPP